MKQDFTPNTIEENAQFFANMLPGGQPFAAKNIYDSNLRKLLKGFAYEGFRFQGKIYELSEEDYIPNTINLIEAWESALGIPDECFNIKPDTLPIEQRRKQVIAKLAKLHLTTEADWINLAAFFGFTIQIIRPIAGGHFDYDFDFYMYDDDKNARFTMIVRFMGMTAPENVFSCTFSIHAPDTDPSFIFDDTQLFIICLFEHAKPANVHVIYEYEFP